MINGFKIKQILTEKGGFKMKRPIKFLFPLIALSLISIPLWAATPGKLASDNMANFSIGTDYVNSLLLVEPLKYQYLLARGGNGGSGGNGNGGSGGNGGGSGNGNGGSGGNGGNGGNGNGDGNGNGGENGNGANSGNGGGQQVQNQHQHQHQKQYQAQQDEPQQNQNQHQYQQRHGQSQ